MTLPKRKKREPMGVRAEAQIRCPQHLAWVRQCFRCAVTEGRAVHECFGKIEAAHVRGGTDGGMGVKPSDCFVIPLCSAAHREQHNVGEAEFQRIYGINMRRIADSLWLKSPHGRRYRAEHQ
jgi:hypothetical protein